MQIIKAGQFIQSTSLLENTIFENSNILICEVNTKGAWGFVMNKMFYRTLNELTAFQNSIPFPIYEGGPMEIEKLFFIHQRPDLIEGGHQIDEHYYWSGNFLKAVELINDKLILENEIQLFIGYCGWDTHQLEAEIEEGSWILS